MKQAYLEQVAADSVKEKVKPDIEDCDEDLTKPTQLKRLHHTTIQKKWVERKAPNDFIWGKEQQQSFDHIKRSTSTNVMTGADLKVQYHLTADASKMCIRGVLFQLHNTSSNEDLTLKN